MSTPTTLVDGLALDITREVAESVIIDELLDLDGKLILELGCGRAVHTRAIAEAGRDRQVLALEVDETQHALNLQIDDLPNVRFALGGAEEIPAADASQDVVFLFKSLHHVPGHLMAAALQEVARVLKPGGFAYVSEPLFRGPLNECLRLFHDEQAVRREAFAAITAAVDLHVLESVSQTFFLAPVHFADFAEYERLVIGATHSEHIVTDEVRVQVQERFAKHVGADGANFAQPIRVDLLRSAL